MEKLKPPEPPGASLSLSEGGELRSCDGGASTSASRRSRCAPGGLPRPAASPSSPPPPAGSSFWLMNSPMGLSQSCGSSLPSPSPLTPPPPGALFPPARNAWRAGP